MVRDAVDSLGGKTTEVAVHSWILERYPGSERSAIGCQMTMATLTPRSRDHCVCPCCNTDVSRAAGAREVPYLEVVAPRLHCS